eukprot:COSAG02_NODE_67065_length_254_cov_0.496774_1_plen_56_part_01
MVAMVMREWDWTVGGGWIELAAKDKELAAKDKEVAAKEKEKQELRAQMGVEERGPP